VPDQVDWSDWIAGFIVGGVAAMLLFMLLDKISTPPPEDTDD
jgi:hypothetical protein